MKTLISVCTGVSLMISAFCLSASELVDAAKNGDLNTVINLIEAGENVNQATDDGTTALAHAAWYSHLEMVDYLLLKAEAEVNITNDYGATPLYLAALNAELPVIDRLLKAGAIPDAGLLSGETPLMAAANRGRSEVVDLLLSRGADPNLAELNLGQTALMWAASERFPDVIDLLIKYGADVDARSFSGFTPLLFATRQGDARIVKMFLDEGADIEAAMCTSGPSARVRYEELAGKDFKNTECGSGLNALMIATLGGFTDVAEILLDRGADPNMIDKSGKTVLHHAAASRVEIVRALLAHGADPDIRVSNPRGSGRFGLRVTEQGATPMVIAADNNNLEVVTTLLEYGADPGITTEQKTSTLHMAAGAGTSPADSLTDEAIAAATEIVRVMVDRGVSVNARGPFGWTALHAAAYHGRNAIIEILIRQGADPNLMDDFGQTPLSISYAIVTEGMGDNYNQTPRIYRKDTADLLLSLGATPLESSGVRVVAERAIE